MTSDSQEYTAHDPLPRSPSYRHGDDGQPLSFSKRSFAARASDRPDLSLDTAAAFESDRPPPQQQQPAPVERASTAAAANPPTKNSRQPRRGSLVERSPLQQLELTLGDLSREEKRTRADGAEQLDTRRSNSGNHKSRTVEQQSTPKRTKKVAIAEPEGAQQGVGSSESTALKPSSSIRGVDTSAGRPYQAKRTSAVENRLSHFQSLAYAQGGDSGTPTAPNFTTYASSDRRSGYDSARTGSAAAAAISVFQLARRRQVDPLSPQAEPLGLYGSTETFGNPQMLDYDSSRTDLRIFPPSRGFEQPTTSEDIDRIPSFQQSVDSDGNVVSEGSAHGDHTPLGSPGAAHQRGAPSGDFADEPEYRLLDPDDSFAGSHEPLEPEQSARSPKSPERSRSRRKRLSMHASERRYKRGRILDEWKSGQTAILSGDYIDLESDVNRNATWWEQERPARRSSVRRSARQSVGPKPLLNVLGNHFEPPLVLKCGPLLRYTGIKTVHHGQTRKEFWRGSVMIVTEDIAEAEQSAPTLRLFKQPPRPPQQSSSMHMDGNEVSSEDEQDNALASLVKCSRLGEPLVAKPADTLVGGIDRSRTEGSEGLFEHAPPAPEVQPVPDGESLGKYREISAHRLHVERGFTFWRFNLEVELGPTQARIAYRINEGPAIGFWIPGNGETMNMMFHSCNGFSLSVDSNQFSGPDPMWRDVLTAHEERPFHVMIGGGDQIYNDAATRDTQYFKTWLSIKSSEQKQAAPFSEEMQNELELFYLNRYSMWFSQGLFGMANSQIPMVNIWDDHDIIDGFGSYPHKFMGSPVFSGIGSVAFKYYMLFQHQSVPEENSNHEPSWLLGSVPGPYIEEVSRSVFVSLGRSVALLGLDCRTERMHNEILSQETYDNVFCRCREEIMAGETRHLIVLIGVPMAYPRLNALENVLTSRLMDPIKALGRTGMLGGFVNKFDGGVEILDDLNDHWTAKHHKEERNWFVQELQELAAEKSVRVTILGGDVHLAAVGQFFSNKKLGIPKDRDHRYMANVISSAIVNTPPPVRMSDIINSRNKTHHLDEFTDENMVALFSHDVDGRSRNNRHLLPRRNWCSIHEYEGTMTPAGSVFGGEQEEEEERGWRRRLSFSRSRSNSRGSLTSRSRSNSLLRVLSLGKRDREIGPPSSFRAQEGEDYAAMQSPGSESFRGRQLFQRKPSNSSDAAGAMDGGGADGLVELQGGLEIALHCEVDQRDPRGTTSAYRVVVPALWYGDEWAEPEEGDDEGERAGHVQVKPATERHLDDETAAYVSALGQPSIDDGGRAMGFDSDADPKHDAHQRPQQRGSHDSHDSHAADEAYPPPPRQPSQPSQPTREQLRRMPRASGDIETEQPLYQQRSRSPASNRSRSTRRAGSSGGQPMVSSARASSDQSRAAHARAHPATVGPPPPSNIEQLPASVRKRYSSWDQPSPSPPAAAAASSSSPTFDSPRLRSIPPLTLAAGPEEPPRPPSLRADEHYAYDYDYDHADDRDYVDDEHHHRFHDEHHQTAAAGPPQHLDAPSRPVGSRPVRDPSAIGAGIGARARRSLTYALFGKPSSSDQPTPTSPPADPLLQPASLLAAPPASQPSSKRTSWFRKRSPRPRSNKPKSAAAADMSAVEQPIYPPSLLASHQQQQQPSYMPPADPQVRPRPRNRAGNADPSKRLSTSERISRILMPFEDEPPAGKPGNRKVPSDYVPSPEQSATPPSEPQVRPRPRKASTAADPSKRLSTSERLSRILMPFEDEPPPGKPGNRRVPSDYITTDSPPAPASLAQSTPEPAQEYVARPRPRKPSLNSDGTKRLSASERLSRILMPFEDEPPPGKPGNRRVPSDYVVIEQQDPQQDTAAAAAKPVAQPAQEYVARPRPRKASTNSDGTKRLSTSERISRILMPFEDEPPPGKPGNRKVPSDYVVNEPDASQDSASASNNSGSRSQPQSRPQSRRSSPDANEPDSLKKTDVESEPTASSRQSIYGGAATNVDTILEEPPTPQRAEIFAQGSGATNSNIAPAAAAHSGVAIPRPRKALNSAVEADRKTSNRKSTGERISKLYSGANSRRASRNMEDSDVSGDEGIARPRPGRRLSTSERLSRFLMPFEDEPAPGQPGNRRVPAELVEEMDAKRASEKFEAESRRQSRNIEKMDNESRRVSSNMDDAATLYEAPAARPRANSRRLSTSERLSRILMPFEDEPPAGQPGNRKVPDELVVQMDLKRAAEKAEKAEAESRRQSRNLEAESRRASRKMDVTPPSDGSVEGAIPRARTSRRLSTSERLSRILMPFEDEPAPGQPGNRKVPTELVEQMDAKRAAEKFEADSRRASRNMSSYDSRRASRNMSQPDSRRMSRNVDNSTGYATPSEDFAIPYAADRKGKGAMANGSSASASPAASDSPTTGAGAATPQRHQYQAFENRRASRPADLQLSPQRATAPAQQAQAPQQQQQQQFAGPYNGPGLSDRHEDRQDGIPLPRPVGLGMSERAARQLGHDAHSPETKNQEYGSWLARQSTAAAPGNTQGHGGVAQQRQSYLGPEMVPGSGEFTPQRMERVAAPPSAHSSHSHSHSLTKRGGGLRGMMRRLSGRDRRPAAVGVI